MTDSEIIQAFIASGLELREWESNPGECNSYRKRLALDSSGELQVEVWLCEMWKPCDGGPREIANEILRQLHEDCDVAGVDVNVQAGGQFYMSRFSGVCEQYLADDGTWTNTNMPATYPTRPEALLAAYVAIDHPNTNSSSASMQARGSDRPAST